MDILGTFETVEQASEAAQKLRDLFADIGFAKADGWPVGTPSSLERYYEAALEIEWPEETLNGWVSAHNGAVAQFGTSITTSDFYDRKGLAIQDLVARLIVKWGGVPIVEKQFKDLITVDLTCHVSELEASYQIRTQVEPYLTLVMVEKSAGISPPWRDFSVPLDSGHDDELFAGHFSQDGEELRFSMMKFHCLGPGLSALLGYLNAHYCTDIQYTFKLRDVSEIFPHL